MSVLHGLVDSNATVSGQVMLTARRPISLYVNSAAGGAVFAAFGVESETGFARLKAAGGLDLCVLSGGAGWFTLESPITPWMRLETSAAVASSVRSFQVWPT